MVNRVDPNSSNHKEIFISFFDICMSWCMLTEVMVIISWCIKVKSLCCIPYNYIVVYVYYIQIKQGGGYKTKTPIDTTFSF